MFEFDFIVDYLIHFVVIVITDNKDRPGSEFSLSCINKLFFCLGGKRVMSYWIKSDVGNWIIV